MAMMPMSMPIIKTDTSITGTDGTGRTQTRGARAGAATTKQHQPQQQHYYLTKLKSKNVKHVFAVGSIVAICVMSLSISHVWMTDLMTSAMSSSNKNGNAMGTTTTSATWWKSNDEAEATPLMRMMMMMDDDKHERGQGSEETEPEPSMIISSNTHIQNTNIQLPGHVTHPHRRNDYNFTVGVCCIAKDAEPYLEEWLDYQLLALEFDAVMLYDNSDEFVLQHWYARTRDHPVYRKVKVFHFPGLNGGRIQRKVYTHCFDTFGNKKGREEKVNETEAPLTPTSQEPPIPITNATKSHQAHLRRSLQNINNYTSSISAASASATSNTSTSTRFDYLALIDVDEFIVLKQHESLKGMNVTSLGPVHNQSTDGTIAIVDRIHDLIETVWRQPPAFGRGALVLNWMLVGYSQKTLYTPLPVLKRFQHRAPSADETIKSIVHMPDVDDLINPHAVALKRPAQYWAMDVVHTGQPAQFKNNAKASVQGYTYERYMNVTHHSINADSNSTNYDEMAPYSDTALLYHIRYTSLEEYRQKRCERKEVNGQIKGCDMNIKNSKPRLYMSAAEDPRRPKWPEHNYPFAGAVLDDAPWRFLKWKVPKYRVYDAVLSFTDTNTGTGTDNDGTTASATTKTTPAFSDFHSMSLS
jgi:hypothetical protein